jgi:serine/threonine protein kinase
LIDPSIGKIIDSDLDGKIAWIATEFINGPTLEVKVKYEGPLDELPWFRLASNLFHAITTAHELNVIHKDIKPSNIVLGETGTKLIDFGIAHVSGRTQTVRYGDREGSIAFSSPEHFLPKGYPKMDVFSAAATLAYAGKGKSIWPGESELQLMRNINEDVPDLEGLTERQKLFLIPLLEKNESERSSAREALTAANSFIEELIPLSEQNGRKFSQLNLRTGSGKNTKLMKAVALGIPIALILGVSLYASISKSADTSAPEQLGSKPNIGLISPTPDASDLLSGTAGPGASPRTSVQSSKTPGTKSLTSDLSNCIKYVSASEFSKALASCTGASKNGNLDALYNLGLAYEGSKDLPNARTTFENCSKRQDFRCTSELAYFISREGKTEEARAMWNSAVDKGWANAAVALGFSYDLKEDYPTAIKWWKKAVELGETKAASYISDTYSSDLKDYANALIWAKRMLKDNVPGADQRIGYIYDLQGKKDDAKQYLTNCGNAGNISCMSMLSLIYFDEEDSPKAVIWAKRAAAEKFVPSYNLLARIYMWLDYDLAQAKIWAQKSASTGDLEGMYTVGVLLTLVDNDKKASCLQYTQILAKANSMIKNNTNTVSANEWFSKANDQYQKSDCKNS